MPLPVPVGNDPNWQGWQGVQSSGHDQEDPSAKVGAYWGMLQRWTTMRAVLDSQYLRSVSGSYITQLPQESDDCYQRRLSTALFSPFTRRLVEGAIGLILRKPVILEGGNEAFWEDWRLNVDRQGTPLDEFLRSVLRTSIGYGHAGILVDFPKAEGVRTLADERQAQLAPYFNLVEPFNIYGWRQDARENAGKLQQVRLRELVTKPVGRFGEEVVEQIRVLEPGSYTLYQRAAGNSGGWEEVESGTTSLSEVPLCVTYAEKQAVLVSAPIMLDVAYINLAHYRLQSQHLNALQVAGFPLLVLKGWDDQSPQLQLDVSKALAMPPEGDVSYVEPANAAFQAYMDELSSLEEQMGALGVAVLQRQKMVAEAAKKASLDRADSNSMLAAISMDLEQTLQAAIDMAAEYAGQEAPTVAIDRDFEAAPMDSAGIGAVVQLVNAGIIDQGTALDMLQKGEILDDSVDIDEIMSTTEQKELEGMEQELDRQEAQMELSSKYEQPSPVKPPVKNG